MTNSGDGHNEPAAAGRPAQPGSDPARAHDFVAWLDQQASTAHESIEHAYLAALRRIRHDPARPDDGETGPANQHGAVTDWFDSTHGRAE